MDAIMGPEYSAFTKGRLISDNILINHELMYNLKPRRYGRNFGMALKFDISKVYECVEWIYLR